MKNNSTGSYANTWFLKNDTTSILKVPSTPGSKLVNLLKEKAGGSRGPDKGVTKFVELGGLPISFTFPNKEYLMGKSGCQYSVKCYISDDQDCRIARGIYRILCVTCQERDGLEYVYIGTSGFSIHKRLLEHASCVRSKSASNALAKHIALHHEDNTQITFVSEIVQGGIKYNLERFIFEALEIEDARNDPNTITMNSRSEWGGRGLPRIQVIHN